MTEVTVLPLISLIGSYCTLSLNLCDSDLLYFFDLLTRIYCTRLTSVAEIYCTLLTSMTGSYCTFLTSMTGSYCIILTSLTGKCCTFLTSMTARYCALLTSMTGSYCTFLTSMAVFNYDLYCCPELYSFAYNYCNKLYFLN